jgi:lipid-binding SYLF domain-containing protein
MQTFKEKLRSLIYIVALLSGILSSGVAGISYAAAEDIGGTAKEASTHNASTLTAEQKQQRRMDILAMKDRTLADLYKLKPEARMEINKAAGYGVFDVAGAFIVLLVTEHGAGVLIDNSTGKPTYVTMTRLGTGPGVGYEKFRSVIVFKSKKILDLFKSAGADVEASGHLVLKDGTDGGALGAETSFNPDLSVYQFTDFGFAAEASWGGVAFLPDWPLAQ